MAFAVRAAVGDPAARTFTFQAQKTMYGGKRIATGDTVFIFASENEGEAAPGAPRAEALCRLERRPPRNRAQFQIYRQATNKIAAISDDAAAFLRGFF